MSGPARTAFEALAAALAARLVAEGFLAAAAELAVDEEADWEREGARSVAALNRTETAATQRFMGLAAPRYEVRLAVLFEAGAEGAGAREQLDKAAAALGGLLAEDEDLAGAALRLELADGVQIEGWGAIGFRLTARLDLFVSAGDPLGVTP